MAKNHKLLKRGLNKVVPILFNVVNNIVQHCYTRFQAGFRLNNLFSVVENIEQCGQHNIGQSCLNCFQQPSTIRNFYTCRHCIDQLQNLVTAPSCDMETRLIMQKHDFSCLLFYSFFEY